MNKFEEKVAFYESIMDELKISYDHELFTKIVKGLGPSVFKRDAECVSSSDEKEIRTVKQNFLIGKLGLEDSENLDRIIRKAALRMGKTNRHKYRAIIYYLLVKELGRESRYYIESKN
ncbi:MAG: DUF2853 family protein [Flavobacteriaceae bacterium]|nr:MAG: DUF2853 family protein [Flavobacteriaceae bacterium]